MNDPLRALRAFLATTSEGPIEPDRMFDLTALLNHAWPALSGDADATAMAAYKISRAEQLTWRRPRLSFEIVRHGATVQGSTRGERQAWNVNVETGEAEVASVGYRQIDPPAHSVSVEPLVDHLVHAIQTHAEHPALRWLSDARVRVTVARISQLDSPYRETKADRSRRFRATLTKHLEHIGWDVVSGSRLDYEKRTEA